jgi:ketosteroid isomerase-like protein
VSRENVEIVQQAFQRYAETGEPQLDGLDDEVEVHDHDIPDAGVYRGHEGFTRWLSDWSEPWEGFSMEPERWIDAGDRVVFTFRMTARGKGSGIEVNRRDAMVWTMRDGITVRIDYYNSEAQALEAVGLSEQEAVARAA